MDVHVAFAQLKRYIWKVSTNAEGCSAGDEKKETYKAECFWRKRVHDWNLFDSYIMCGFKAPLPLALTKKNKNCQWLVVEWAVLNVAVTLTAS